MTKNMYEPDPEKINEAVEKSKSKAEDYLKDPEKSKKLLDDAMKKAKSREKPTGPLADLWENLRTAFRLLQAYFSKKYTTIPWASIVLVVGSVIYFVSPIDLMPDWFPLAGFIDDAAVLVFVLRQINSDLQRFLEWENEQNTNSSEKIIDINLKNK
ncbi:MAG: YkvA family protein [Anaerolineaceae bacterium]